jgi:hypothetical protein
MSDMSVQSYHPDYAYSPQKFWHGNYGLSGLFDLMKQRTSELLMKTSQVLYAIHSGCILAKLL